MDIIFSVGLLIFSLYCFWLVGAQSPLPTPTELGAAFWPRIILALLAIFLIVNIVNGVKKMKADGNGFAKDLNLGVFFKSKLLIGMIMVAVMAVIMPYIGFIPVCFLFLLAYGFLLGERRWGRLILISLIITFILYILFQGALDIMLARGVGFFREFALTCETILPF